jgi:4-hydroxy-3-methylbut-2-enyl diphosphate reductase
MIVLRADTLGVCRGVRRALAIVEQAIAENPGTPMYTLGPLIHNPRVVEEFKTRGVVPIDDVSQAREGLVIVSAHGIGPGLAEECESRGVRVIDATCPDVRRIQRMVREYSTQGCHVLIVGDENHREVIGIRGWAAGSSVVASVEEAERVELPAECIVVGQTTFKRAEYRAICEVLTRRRPGLTVFDTSCASTETRQRSLLSLSERVEALIVVGGKESANTRWLYQTALQTGKPSWHIEGAAEIPAELSGCGSVGISAGASTPDEVIDEVEESLLALPASGGPGARSGA